jgi:hypothetical protein
MSSCRRQNFRVNQSLSTLPPAYAGGSDRSRHRPYKRPSEKPTAGHREEQKHSREPDRRQHRLARPIHFAVRCCCHEDRRALSSYTQKIRQVDQRSARRGRKGIYLCGLSSRTCSFDAADGVLFPNLARSFHSLDQRFHMVEIPRQRGAALFCDRVFGQRHAAFE